MHAKPDTCKGCTRQRKPNKGAPLKSHHYWLCTCGCKECEPFKGKTEEQLKAERKLKLRINLIDHRAEHLAIKDVQRAEKTGQL